MEARRIVVVGCSGAGKSTFARRCAALGYAHLELDGVMHQAQWTKLEDDAARARIDAFTAQHARWIVDGNYAQFRDLVWARADTVVWLDLERPVVVASVALRSLRRLVLRTELWNGNRERWREVLSLDPDRSVVSWAWTQHARYRSTYERARLEPEWAHLRWVRLRSRGEVEAILARSERAGRLAFEAGSGT